MKTLRSGPASIAMGLLALASSVPALAGEPARSMAALEERVQPGTPVDVVDRQGRVLRGDFARADDEGVLITLYGNSEGRRVPAADIMSVTRSGDSLKNGALIGAAVGLVSGILVTTYEDPYAAPVCVDTGCKIGLTGVLTAMYGGIGALIDHLIKGRTVVYRAPVDRIAWSVAPHPVPRGAGIQLALRF